MYSVDVVQTQAVHRGEVGKEAWLGVKLIRSGEELLGWVQSGVPQKRVAGDAA